MLSKKYNDSPEEDEKEIYNIEENIPSTMLELTEWIDERIEKKPDGRNKKGLQQWKKDINILINTANIKCGFKMYKEFR